MLFFLGAEVLSLVVLMNNMNCVANWPDSCPSALVSFVIFIVGCFAFQEVAESVKEDFGSIDILVHSLANGPEVR